MQVLRDAFGFIKTLSGELPQVWPEELPPESSPGFWWDVIRVEQATRGDVDGWLRQRLKAAGGCPATALTGFFVRRRIEWATQLILAYAQTQACPPLALPQMLDFLLIQNWETDGCEGLWAHAEREGQPHPENPDGLSPLL